MNRLNKANTDDFFKSRLADSILENNSVAGYNIMFGVVVKNDDPLNANRVKVRILKIDDSFFENSSLDEAINNLAWALRISRNFIGTPETNSIVAIQFLNPKTPSSGRIYIDCMTDLNESELFELERLTEEFKTYLNFENVQTSLNVKLQSNPEIDYEVEENIKYNVGIKGKGENKVLLKKDSIEITQNGGDKESKIVINNNIIIETSDTLKLISKLGNQEYHPVFHKPLYDYITKINGLLKSIITIQTTIPSICTACGVPNTPNPNSYEMIEQIISLYKSFAQLKIDGNGHSKYVWVN